MLDTVVMEDVKNVMADMGVRAKTAAQTLATALPEAKNKALMIAAEKLWETREAILTANEKDMQAAKSNGISAAFLDRLKLDEEMLQRMRVRFV